MDSVQERRISNLLQSIKLSEIAGESGQVPRSYPTPSPTRNERDDKEEEEWLCSDQVEKTNPEVDHIHSNDSESGFATSSCLDSLYTKQICLQSEELGPPVSGMNDVDYWNVGYQKEGKRSSETALRSSASVEKQKNFDDILSAFGRKVDEDDEEFDDMVENKDASNSEEDFGEQRATEEDSREEEDDACSQINFNCEGQEDSNFMFDFCRNVKGKREFFICVLLFCLASLIKLNVVMLLS